MPSTRAEHVRCHVRRVPDSNYLDTLTFHRRYHVGDIGTAVTKEAMTQAVSGFVRFWEPLPTTADDWPLRGGDPVGPKDYTPFINNVDRRMRESSALFLTKSYELRINESRTFGIPADSENNGTTKRARAMRTTMKRNRIPRFHFLRSLTGIDFFT